MTKTEFLAFTTMFRGSFLAVTHWIDRYKQRPADPETLPDWLEFLDVVRSSFLEITTWIANNKAKHKGPASMPPLPSLPAGLFPATHHAAQRMPHGAELPRVDS